MSSVEVKTAWVKVMQRLSRETQLHLDERYRAFKLTDGIIIATSILLAILAIFNIYYVYLVSKDMRGIVENMSSMHDNMRIVKDDVVQIRYLISDIDVHMEQMDGITDNMLKLSDKMQLIPGSTSAISDHTQVIDNEMQRVHLGMHNIEVRYGGMTRSVSNMRYNTRKIAKPMRIIP